MSAKRKMPLGAPRQTKDERMYGPRNEDAYQSRGKYREPCLCTGCGAVFHKGRWQWGIAKEGAHRHLCPACQRVHDRVPAGILEIRGGFFAGHRQEIIGLIHNTEAREKAEHPLQRIMKLAVSEDGLIATCTDFHLTHRLGEALQNAYEGRLNSRYTDKDGVMRVTWTR